MILVDKPYLSDFLKESSRKHGLPIVNTQAAQEFGLGEGDNLIVEGDAIKWLRARKSGRIYTNSENAIGWIKALLTANRGK